MSWIKSASIFLCSSAVALALLEVGSRQILPISPGAMLYSTTSDDRLDISFNEKGASYRQVFAEYDVPTNIDFDGNRITPTSDLKSDHTVIFLGDSFTFGQGVDDLHTVPSIFCSTVRVRCVNLGVPGTGLIAQYKKLEQYAGKSYRDNNRVYHLMLVSTEARHAGNDISDTLAEASAKPQLAANTSDLSSTNDYQEKSAIVAFARWLSINSNAFRVFRTLLGNQLRSFAWRDKANAFNEQELGVFKNAWTQLKTFASSSNLDYHPVLISTYSELKSSKKTITREKLEKLLGTDFVDVDFANEKLEVFFFPLDGHANKVGNAEIAEDLIAHYRESIYE